MLDTMMDVRNANVLSFIFEGIIMRPIDFVNILVNRGFKFCIEIIDNEFIYFAEFGDDRYKLESDEYEMACAITSLIVAKS